MSIKQKLRGGNHRFRTMILHVQVLIFLEFSSFGSDFFLYTYLFPTEIASINKFELIMIYLVIIWNYVYSR